MPQKVTFVGRHRMFPDAVNIWSAGGPDACPGKVNQNQFVHFQRCFDVVCLDQERMGGKSAMCVHQTRSQVIASQLVAIIFS